MDLSFLTAPFITPRKNVIRKLTKFRPALASSYINYSEINYFVVVATLIRKNRKELWSMAVFGHKGKNFHFTLRCLLLYLSFSSKIV